MAYRIGLYFAAAIILCGYSVAAADEPRQTIIVLKAGAECPGTVLDATIGVVCLFTYPKVDDGSQQTFVTLKSGADCPGVRLEKTESILCLVEHPRGWEPFVYNGLLYYKIYPSRS